MLAFLAVLALLALAPLAYGLLRLLVILHLWMICLFLPAGLLLRLGPGEDIRVFAGVTCVWGLLLLSWRTARAGARARPAMT